MATERSSLLRPIAACLLGGALLTAGCNQTTAATRGSGQPAGQPNPQLQMLDRLNSMESELAALRNTVEVQDNEIRRLRERQADIYEDMDRRLRGLELAGGGPHTPAAPAMAISPADIPPVPESASSEQANPATVADADAPVETMAVASASEQQAYDQAFDLLKQSRYEEAIAAFKEFLNDYPRSALADSAQYWIAEARYVNRAYEAALHEYNTLIRRYPASRRLPDAMLKVGYIHYDNQQWQEARRALNAVVVRYPGSRVAVSAKMRLDQMDKQGN
jgi:tol-pal system protein YbgF